MRLLQLSAPAAPDEHWRAFESRSGLEVRFLGLGPASSREEALEAAGGADLELAWCRQVHGADAVEAASGSCGPGDALHAGRTGIALCVVTADCVPVVVGSPSRVAVIHAGWRGIAAGVVPKTLARLGAGPSLSAWLGPAIGACCYEVGPEVARAVVEASGEQARVDRGSDRPHLDLHAAVAAQLAECGVRDLARVDACTRCRNDALWSYRRLGKGAGRNWTFAWLAGPGALIE